MEVEVISSKENPLFDRKELVVVARDFSATPNRLEVLEALSKKVNALKECIAIRKIEHKFGSKQARILARVYSSAKKLAEIEPAFVKERGKPKEKAAEEKK
ncbi:MAG: hypothetical protein ACP5O3_03775 [Candidatus Micrarchaeia archaeon]|jgi:ribosomal protein S24E